MNKPDYKLCRVIQKLELFRDLDLEDAQRILGFSEQQFYLSQEVVWKAGDPSPSMLILISGSLEGYDPAGERIVRIHPGMTLGEMSCLTGHPRFLNVAALETSTAISLSRANLRKLGRDKPQTFIRILENALDVLAHRLTHTVHPNRRPRQWIQQDSATEGGAMPRWTSDLSSALSLARA